MRVKKAQCKYSEWCGSMVSDILFGLLRTHMILGRPRASHHVTLSHILVVSSHDEALLFWRSHFCGKYATATPTTVAKAGVNYLFWFWIAFKLCARALSEGPWVWLAHAGSPRLIFSRSTVDSCRRPKGTSPSSCYKNFDVSCLWHELFHSMSALPTFLNIGVKSWKTISTLRHCSKRKSSHF